jgi:hypothetical protein
MKSKKNAQANEVSYAMDATEYRMLVSLKETLKTLKKSDQGVEEILGKHFLKGSFIKLSSEKSFQEILFPGIGTDQTEKVHGLPRNLKQILEWDQIQLDENKLVKNAAEVLKNIKLKGNKEGSRMDEQTEMVLLPQIVQEALANQIIELVRAYHCKVNNAVAQLSQVIASSDGEEAQREQLLPPALKQLSEKCSSIQKEFLGAHWSAAVSKDVIRFLEFEKMTPMDAFGNVIVKDMDNSSIINAEPNIEMCWIEYDEHLIRYYPSLSVVIDQLYALPHELNAKYIWDGPDFLQASRGSTMLVRYPAGAHQALRLDCRTSNAQLDSGIRMTAIYHIRRQHDNDLNPIKETSSSSASSTSSFRMRFVIPRVKGESTEVLSVEDDW